MTSVSHEPSRMVPERRRWVLEFGEREVWVALAIVVMWLAVLFDAVFGPDIVNTNGGGTNTSAVPSAVAVAPFAFLGTWVVARYGFRRDRRD